MTAAGDAGAGAGSGAGTGAAGAAGAAGQGSTTYVPPASQEDLDRIVQDRVRRVEAKYSNYDDLVTKAARADALEADLGSESEKAAKKAAADERAKANGEFIPRVVKAEFKAAAKGVLTAEQLTALLEDRDLTKYVDSKGEPDEDKIANLVKAFAPAGGNNGGGGQQPPRSLGQGNQPPATAKPGDSARAWLAKQPSAAPAKTS